MERFGEAPWSKGCREVRAERPPTMQPGAGCGKRRLYWRTCRFCPVSSSTALLCQGLTATLFFHIIATTNGTNTWRLRNYVMIHTSIFMKVLIIDYYAHAHFGIIHLVTTVQGYSRVHRFTAMDEPSVRKSNSSLQRQEWPMLLCLWMQLCSKSEQRALARPTSQEGRGPPCTVRRPCRWRQGQGREHMLASQVQASTPRPSRFPLNCIKMSSPTFHTLKIPRNFVKYFIFQGKSKILKITLKW